MWDYKLSSQPNEKFPNLIGFQQNLKRQCLGLGHLFHLNHSLYQKYVTVN